jgi:hypothetical protein
MLHELHSVICNYMLTWQKTYFGLSKSAIVFDSHHPCAICNLGITALAEII